MLEQDYLMRMILQFIQGIRMSIQGPDKDPLDSAEALEHAIADAVHIDRSTLFSLDAQSFVLLMRVSAIDEALVPYLVHTMMLEAVYLTDAHKEYLAALRTSQAQALADAYDVALLDEKSLRALEFLDLDDLDNRIEV